MDTIKNHNFCMIEFLQTIKRQGFEFNHSGGESHMSDYNHSVITIHQQYQLGTGKHSMLTCSATSFYKTFLSVEESFDFRLFG